MRCLGLLLLWLGIGGVLLAGPEPPILYHRPPPAAEENAAINTANALLEKEIPVITAKTKLPESGDKHDYYSIGIYWWPNSLTGGKPYFQRDGRVNPESKEYDHPVLIAFGRGVKQLAVAAAVSGDPKYAEAARAWLRAWMLDPETRMNPNLRHAQAWPGWNAGTPTGILEGVILAENVPDAVALLRGQGALPDEEYQAIRAWFAQLVEWLEESGPGKAIAKTRHNHANWYDVQRVSYHLFLGNDREAKAILERVGPDRIAKQIRPDGSMPAELKRTKSFDYTCYSLRPIMMLCELGDRFDLDLWNYTAPENGGSVRKALDFLLPYATEAKPWPYEQFNGFRPQGAGRLLRQAAAHFPDAGYETAAETIQENVKKKSPTGTPQK